MSFSLGFLVIGFQCFDDTAVDLIPKFLCICIGVLVKTLSGFYPEITLLYFVANAFVGSPARVIHCFSQVVAYFTD